MRNAPGGHVVSKRKRPVVPNLFPLSSPPCRRQAPGGGSGVSRRPAEPGTRARGAAAVVPGPRSRGSHHPVPADALFRFAGTRPPRDISRDANFARPGAVYLSSGGL